LPDTCFAGAAGGRFDAAVAMYHDQGHIPIIRTSVDHGVAFDIAGKGIASADSMVAAIELAAKMAAS